MTNVLIVGANEGIGYYLVERLLESGNTVTVLDIKVDAVEKLRRKYQEVGSYPYIRPVSELLCKHNLLSSTLA